ncbi:MAG: hypothetical protein ABL951_01760 [Alphaproteobacteria bacterium]
MNDPKEEQKKGCLRFMAPVLGVLALLFFVFSLPAISQWVGDNYYLVVHGEKRPPSNGPFRLGPYQYSRVEYPVPESKITDNMSIQSDTIDRLTFHPDGGSVLFDFCPETSNCRLMSFDLATKQLKTVFGTHGIPGESPSYSPDGKQIVFIALINAEDSEKRTLQVYLINADGSNIRPLTNRRRLLPGNPSFSPDGKFVIYQASKLFTAPDFYRVNVETAISELILHIDGQAESPAEFSNNVVAFPAFFGSSDEIIFFLNGYQDSKSRAAAVPCQDSRPDPIRNPNNARLCKVNLITGVSTTLYNAEAVFKIFPSHGPLPILFASRVNDADGYADYARFMAHDGSSATLISEWFRMPEPGHMQEKFPAYISLSSSGDRIASLEYGDTIKKRIADFNGTKPRLIVRNLKTGARDVYLVPIPDEEFTVYRHYVKPKLTGKPGH